MTVPADELDRRRNALFLIAIGAVVIFGMLYILAVQTSWGQRLDTAALRGRLILSRREMRAAFRLHHAIDIYSLALVGGAILLVAIARRRVRLAIGVAVLIAGSILTAEFLKHTLGRPILSVDALGSHPSFPSGHLSVAMSLSVGATFVAPRRYRAAVAMLGVFFTCLVGCSVVANASHRPSDVIGAAFVVTAWSAVVAALLVRPTRSSGDRPASWLQVPPWMALAGVACLLVSFLVAVVSLVALHNGGFSAVHLGRAFVAASAAIVGTILVCVAALLMALGEAELDYVSKPSYLSKSKSSPPSLLP